MASSSSPPPLSHHQQTVDCHHFVISSRTIGKHEILYITDLEPSTFDSPLLYPPAYQSLPRHPYLPFRPRLARPFLRLFPHSVYNPNLHSIDLPLPPIRRAYHHQPSLSDTNTTTTTRITLYQHADLRQGKPPLPDHITHVRSLTF